MWISISQSNGRAKITIEDNGVGFGERVLTLMQEPFYTTRSSGDGMGLGLSITSAIVKEHKGLLSAESKPDGGAIFVVDLPIASKTDWNSQ